MIAVDGREWKHRVLASGPCVVHRGSGCEGPMQAHHVITQQSLRKHGWSDFRWETDNGVPVCERAHTRHTSAVERIPYRLLPERVIRFAVAVGLDYQLERYYPLDVQNLGS